MARACCADAARLLADVAESAGAPDGSIQVVEHPTVALVETLMSDPVTDVIVATGGTAMVRAAYRSGNPALGSVAPRRPDDRKHRVRRADDQHEPHELAGGACP